MLHVVDVTIHSDSSKYISTLPIGFNYRFEGSLFNLGRLRAKTRVSEEVARDFLFADDCDLAAGSQADLQHTMNLFSSACDNFVLTISIKKTEVMYQPALGKPYEEPIITMNCQNLLAVDNFTYLGNKLSQVVHIDEEINSRIAKGRAAFGQLREKVWDRADIRYQT